MATRRLPAEKRKTQIVLSAIRVFARKGYHGATTREIASEAGVAEALLYRYFDSKQALFIAALEGTASRLVGELERIVEEEKTPERAIERLVTFYRGIVDANADFARMVFVISAELDDAAVRSTYLPYQERALTCLSGAIQTWQAGGLIEATIPPRAAAWVLMGSFQVIALMKHTGRLGELHIEPAMELVRTFLRPSQV